MNDKIEELRRSADQLERLSKEFPDLHEYQTRWKTVLVSKQVVPEKTSRSYSCGCCADAALYQWFYVVRDGKYVYTDPPFICIGAKNEYYGSDEPINIMSEEWEDVIRDKLGDKALDLCKSYRED